MDGMLQLKRTLSKRINDIVSMILEPVYRLVILKGPGESSMYEKLESSTYSTYLENHNNGIHNTRHR